MNKIWEYRLVDFKTYAIKTWPFAGAISKRLNFYSKNVKADSENNLYRSGNPVPGNIVLKTNFTDHILAMSDNRH